jgi:hypothetical protein
LGPGVVLLEETGSGCGLWCLGRGDCRETQKVSEGSRRMPVQYSLSDFSGPLMGSLPLGLVLLDLLTQ